MSKEKQPSKMPVFTERFRKFYAETGDNTIKFSEKAGITRQALNSYLNENRIPDSEALRKICSAYNVSADYLLGFSEVKNADQVLQAACEYTGLSEKAIEAIHQLSTREKAYLDLYPEERTTVGFALALGRIISANQKTLITMLRHILDAWDAYERHNRLVQQYAGNDDIKATALKMNHHDPVTEDIVLSPYESAEFCLSQAAECFKAICKVAKDGES